MINEGHWVSLWIKTAAEWTCSIWNVKNSPMNNFNCSQGSFQTGESVSFGCENLTLNTMETCRPWNVRCALFMGWIYMKGFFYVDYNVLFITCFSNSDCLCMCGVVPSVLFWKENIYIKSLIPKESWVWLLGLFDILICSLSTLAWFLVAKFHILFRIHLQWNPVC